METRDLEALIRLYEPDALLAPEPGVRRVGRDQLRQAFAELLSIRPRLELTTTTLLESSDLAIASNAWTMRGTAPDGSRVERCGQSWVVLRRDPEAGFRIAIDRL